MKHTITDLRQMQAMPLQAKIRMTERRIKDWYEHWEGKVYLSFSGGKDSTVLKHIVDNILDDVPAVFVNTGLEYPEIQQFVREVKAGKYDCFNNDVEIIRPEMRFDEVIKQYGYPFPSKEVSQKIEEAKSKPDGYAAQSFKPNSEKIKKYGKKYDLSKWNYLFNAPFNVSNRCCDVMKKNPIKKYEKITKRKGYIGSMADESQVRKTVWLKNGCNAFDKKRPTSQPLSFWTDQDVYEYIVKYNVPYASVYGQIYEEEQIPGQMYIDGYHGKLTTTGANRTGCMFCMFGVQRDKLGEDGTLNRFQLMKQTHPKQYEYCINQLGLKEVLEFIGVPYE